MVEALSAVDPGLDDVATKGDIKDVRREIAEAKFEIIKWFFGFLVAQTGLIITAIKWVR